MFVTKALIFYFTFLYLNIVTPQINLHHTTEVNNVLQHNCLRAPAITKNVISLRDIISYCMSELPSQFHIKNDGWFPKFTFADLSNLNVTSQQLYFWSTPIDIIENYQSYLNQLTTNLANEIFYNCTLPRFGPQCEYELPYHYSYHSSLNEIIQDFYKYDGTINVTCYTHLKCNRDIYGKRCLDWSQICDGKIDCLDDGIDEEHCWQLEINECNDDEYRCRNGQCIPREFYNDGTGTPDCLDHSDEVILSIKVLRACQLYDGPSFGCEELAIRRVSYSTLHIAPTYLRNRTIYSTKDRFIHENCWSAFKCLLNSTDIQYILCNKFCEFNECKLIIQASCPYILYYPNIPLLFDDIYFAFRKNDLQYLTDCLAEILYLCYKKIQYNKFFIDDSKIFYNNMTCIPLQKYMSKPIINCSPMNVYFDYGMSRLFDMLNECQETFNYGPSICNKPNMYQCIRSFKCISIHRLINGIDDCPHKDDGNITAINHMEFLKNLNKTHFKCEIINRYIPKSFVRNDVCDCPTNHPWWCEDEDRILNILKRTILFQHICDRFIDLSPIAIEGQDETDETECDNWECNNIYTRCNSVWNCPNGEDEVGCDLSSLFNCSSKYHLCVLPETNQLTCIHIHKINDGNIDCLGGTDESQLCGTFTQFISTANLVRNDFYCMNQSSKTCIRNELLCNRINDCQDGDDEQFCTTNLRSPWDQICTSNPSRSITYVEQFLCNYHVSTRKWEIIFFKLSETYNKFVEHQTKKIETSRMLSSSSIIRMSNKYERRCHRGLDLRVWLDNKNSLTTYTCLCPPSYYGNQCQYQNQRVSLTIRFLALTTSKQISFAIVILLIENSFQQIVHSFEQLTYLSMRDCQLKFNHYFIYSTRPKNSTQNYSIHIDFYEKFSLTYRGSILLPINFTFLPVHRLAFRVYIPSSDDNNIRRCKNVKCFHGKCIKYSNTIENLSFCQCDKGWSGKYCTIQHTCTCSFDSLCIGISAINNRSICVCRMNRFGLRCLLIDIVHQKNTIPICQYNNQSISNITSMIPNQDFVCQCSKGFHGNRCNIADNQLILSFEKDIIISQSIFIHFFQVTDATGAIPTTTFRTIPVEQDSITIYWSQPFHLVFTELSEENYYLTILQNNYNQSAILYKTISSLDRCPNISELFNKTFLQWHLLRRIKYYHLPCQNQTLNLSCFYDDAHLCLCYSFGEKRLANCFKFNNDSKFFCYGGNECENGGRCLQDKSDCAAISICICKECFFGQRCQFSTTGFDLSLDALLGYHILPNLTLNQQPLITRISTAFSIIFIVAGLINGILCVITFKNKIVREVGCGLYLLYSTVATLLIMIMFGLKFFILLLAQMMIISNRSLLQTQCYSFDFLLRVCLYMNQWLNACVAVERAFIATKGVKFNKNKSKNAARIISIILCILIVGTCIHDPFYRRLTDEQSDIDNMKRIWCIVKYSTSNLQFYNSFIQIFHILSPFLINLIAMIIFIRYKSHQQLRMQIQGSYIKVLLRQFQEHKHLLIGPLVLIILTLPRLILAVVSKCMQSANDSWLYLIGYFISLIPSMLTFVIFIVPSQFYRKIFFNSIRKYQTIFPMC